MAFTMASLSEHQIYVFATSLMAAFFVAAMVRLWLLRRVEEQLLKNKVALEKQIVLQQKDLMTVRQESNAWRTEMQRQFDLFRHMASDQLGVEEKRFNELLNKSTRREYELQTALDLAKQMCSELPAAKARILHLESLLESSSGNDSGTDSDDSGGLPMSPVAPMPDLSGGGAGLPIEEELAPNSAFMEPPAFSFPPKVIPAPSAFTKFAVLASSPPIPSVVLVDEIKLTELEQKLADAEKKNTFLQLALTTTRLRTRLKPKVARKATLKKRSLAFAKA